MPVTLETLEIQFKANTASATSSIEKLRAALQKMQGGDMKVTADTKDADHKLQKTRRTLEEMEDTSVSVDADTSKAESALGKLGKVMGALGLIQGAKKVFTIAVDLVNTSYASTSANNRLEMLLPENAQAEIRAYADEMNKLYGLNETGLISMSTNFASAFVGMGVEADKAARYAERLTAAAIDYASALDKTPAEVSDTIMSLMRGNTAVADNIGLFGLTIDKLNKQAEQLKAEGLVPQNMAEGTEKYIALLHEIERNADTQGFTGDWARTFDEYGNQTTALAEQWQTLKENAGNLLQPAATQIVQALNSILLSVNLWTENIGKEDSFTETVKGYFGDYEMTEQEITDLVNSITKPTNDMVAAMQQSRTDLGKAYLEYDSALNGFVSLLNKLYAGGNPITDEQKENLFAAWDAAESAGIDATGGVFDQLKTTVTTMFTTLSGDEGGEIKQAGIELIGVYFQAMEDEAMRRSVKLTTTLNKVLEDGTITSEEMQALQGDVSAVTEQVYKQANITAQGEMARYLDSKNFMPTSDSWLAYYKEGRNAVDASIGDLGKEYETLEKQMYEIAAWSNTDEAKEYGITTPRTGAELMAEAKAVREAQETKMQADLINTVSRMGMSQMLAGITDTVKNGPMSNKDFIEQIMKPVLSQGDFVSEALALQGKGAALSAETLDFISLYQQLNSLIPEGKTLENMLGEDAALLTNSMGALINYDQRSKGQDMYTSFARWLYGWDAASPWVEAGEMPSALLNSVPESKRSFSAAEIIETPEPGFFDEIFSDLSTAFDGIKEGWQALFQPADLGEGSQTPVKVETDNSDLIGAIHENTAAIQNQKTNITVYTATTSSYDAGRGQARADVVYSEVNGP